MKAIAEAYGIGVRAGMITPQQDDETYYRSIAGLPGLSSAVGSAWREDGGVRRPITLKSGEAFSAEQDEIAGDDGENYAED